jgi:DNA-binding response OmpR family regulator
MNNLNVKKVLIVDDETDFVEVLTERVKAWGYDVYSASNGKEALALMKTDKPDIVVLDYLMPEMNGLETLREIRKIDKKLPIIMLTVIQDMVAIKGIEKYDVSAFIPKLSAYSDTQASLKAALDLVRTKLNKNRK